MFRQDGKFKSRWDIFVILLAVWNCFVIPLIVGFDSMNLDDILALQIIDDSIDIIFFLDILVNFRTTFIHN